MRTEQKYIMLESGEFVYLRDKCLSILKERISSSGPDELCLILEILCEKFRSNRDSKSWKRVPTIPKDILSKINRADLEELIDVNYDSCCGVNVHEKVLSTDWDLALAGLICKNEEGEDEDVR